MATEYGKDWKVKVRTAVGPDVFTAIGGETSLRWGRSSQEIDLSDKDSGVYGAKSFGLQTVSIAVSGNLKLPDTGLEFVADTAKSATPELVVQIVKGAIVKYAGLCGVGNFSVDAGKDGPTTYSFDLGNIGAPTTDDLGAAA